MDSLLIKNASYILTMDSESANDLGIINDGYIYIEDDKIVEVGHGYDIKRYEDKKDSIIIDAKGKTVLPGFIDCHTHVIFGGSRVEEYCVKMTDDNPETLKKLAIQTGIYASINMTRDVPQEELEQQTAKRLNNMLLNGTTTIESKSGYGLTCDSEIKMLEINKRLNEKLPIDIVSTFLGAHGWPEGMSKEKYIDILTHEMIPQVAERKLADFCDIWCDEGHYTKDESEVVLKCGQKYGLKAKIHTDAYSYIGGSDLAAEMHMVSADHLNYTPIDVFKKLRDADVIGVVLPGIDFAVKHIKPFNPRPMLDCGLKLALATNCCPGCWAESMQFIIILACRNHGFSPEEAIKASTANSALALNLKDRGVLKKGMKADIQIWDVDTYKDVVYKYGKNCVQTIIKDGKIVADKGIVLNSGGIK